MSIASRPNPSRVDSSSGSSTGFDYDAAFSRNIGWVTEWEQQELRGKTVAIAGLGGVGGAHALTLARLGIGGFHLADLDRFDVVNLNRQMGAFISTVNLEKTAVLAQMTRDVNPELRQRVFNDGVHDGNIDEFLSGVDLFVDGFDFFVMDIRRKVFKRCAELGIPAITAAPIGFGTCYLIFMPGAMTFEDYFRLEGLPEERQYVNFALGFTPKGFHRAYVVDPSRLDLAGRRGPSSAAAIQLCAGVVGAEAVKILLGRGRVHAAPVCHQFDPFLARWSRTRLRFGNAGPLQTLKRHIGYKAFAKLSRNARPKETPVTGSDVERIIDLARWAPSGDNAQPWRFEIIGSDQVRIRLRVEGEDANIYDYANGHPTLLAGGFLLETMRIAASRFGRGMEWRYLGADKSEDGGATHTIEVNLPKAANAREDVLFPYLAIRSVDRRRYRFRALTLSQKAVLEAAAGGGLRIEWRESLRQRWELARLCARSTDIRLRLAKAYDVHKRILDWERRFSPDGVPVEALGADPLLIRVMRSVMRSWDRVQNMNRLPGATFLPRFELDLIPGISSAAYFLVARKPGPGGLHTPEALLRTGERLQRFWLTTTHLGLALQPALAPLCFAHYARKGGVAGRLEKLKRNAAQCFPDDGSIVFMGRIGTPQCKSPVARSVRRRVFAEST
jgi:molybdopterin/thiamine biosynthesis adenylyltransferase/nitroreductase